MKTHLRNKLFQLKLHHEDARTNPKEFEAKLQAASLSQVELKVYSICGMHIFSVSPKIRSQPTVVPLKSSSESGRRHKTKAMLPIEKSTASRPLPTAAVIRRRHNDPKKGRHRHRHHHRQRASALSAPIKKSSLLSLAAETNQVSDPVQKQQTFVAHAPVEDINGTPPVTNTTVNLTNLVARRTRRVNAGKRGGVPSKYKFGDQRIFVGSRLPASSLRRKPVNGAPSTQVTHATGDMKPTEDDKSLLVETKW